MLLDTLHGWLQLAADKTQPKTLPKAEEPPSVSAKNPYDAKARYPHLKTEAGEWSDKKYIPYSPPKESKEQREASLKYQRALDRLSSIEHFANLLPPQYYPLPVWEAAWTAVNDLPPRQANELKDRLVACHPNWQQLENALEKVRSLRGESHAQKRLDEFEENIHRFELWIAKKDAKESLPIMHKSLKRIEWFKQRLQEEMKIADRVISSPVIELSRELKMAKPEDIAVKRRAVLRSMQTPILKAATQEKKSRREQEMAKIDLKNLKEEQRINTFMLERELGATRPREEVVKAMAEIRAGTFKVGRVARVRDWFASKIGNLAGHQNTHGLHTLVEKYRTLAKREEAIEQVLQG